MKPTGHQKVAEEAGIPRFKAVLSKKYGIKDSYPSGLEAFYLGNWLADHSQFKDPHGVIATYADADELQKIMLATGKSLLVSVHTATVMYLKDLANKVQQQAVGQQRPISHLPFAMLESMLSQKIDLCLRQLGNSVNLIFRNPTIRKLIDQKKINDLVEQVVRFSAYAKFVHPEKGKTGEKVPYLIFSKIFAQHYTQYYPHEHLDRPEPELTIESHRGQPEALVPNNPDKQYANAVSADKKMYLYMEDAIRVIAGCLYRLDKDWAKQFFLDNRRPPIMESQEKEALWHLGLADLGRIVHLIEDFFAHSNFIERVVLSKKNEHKDRFFYDADLINKASQGEIIEEEDFDKIIQARSIIKKVRKRLKYYAPGNEHRYNNLESVADDQHLFTGYFDSADAKVAVLETILHAFEDIPESMGLHRKSAVEGSFTFLFGWTSEIIEGVLENATEGEVSIYKQIKGDTWTAKDSVISAYINQYSQELKSATNNPVEKDKIEILKVYFEFIRETWKILAILHGAYKICVDQLKPLWDIITAEKILARPQKLKDYVENLKKHVLDSFAKEVYKTALKRGLVITGDWIVHKYKDSFLDDLGKNRIGSHSLLAKDLPDEPLYSEMFNCAKLVHWVVIHALCRWSDQKNWDYASEKSSGEWIDWEDLLFHFLKHPSPDNSNKEEIIIVPASYEFTTKDNEETLSSIWEQQVHSKGEPFTFEEFLFLNGIEVPYVLQREGGGVSIDIQKLNEWLLIKKMSKRRDGRLEVGISLNIPFNSEVKANIQTTPSWFDFVLSKNATPWQALVDTLVSSEKPFHDLPGIYTFKYLSENERKSKADQYEQLQKELELAYNKSKGQVMR